MNKINKENEETRNKHEIILKEKIKEDEKLIKSHELECKPKIDELTLEVQKWKVKADSVNSQIIIKEDMIKNLQETLKRKDEDIMKKSKIIKNYESTYH